MRGSDATTLFAVNCIEPGYFDVVPEDRLFFAAAPGRVPNRLRSGVAAERLKR